MEWARTVRQDPTTDREAARRPYAFTLPRRRGSCFGGFVTRSKESLTKTRIEIARTAIASPRARSHRAAAALVNSAGQLMTIASDGGVVSGLVTMRNRLPSRLGW